MSERRDFVICGKISQSSSVGDYEEIETVGSKDEFVEFDEDDEGTSIEQQIQVLL